MNLGPERIHAHLEGHRTEGSDAQELRFWIDNQFGDGDGEVTQDEVDAYAQDRKDDFNNQLRFGGAFFFEPFKINTRNALSHEVTGIHLSESALGPVDSNETIIQEVEALLTFPSTERTRVDVLFEEDFRVPFSQVNMEWGHAVFRTAQPWAIDPSTISPGGSDNPFFVEGEFRVPYDQTGEFSSSQEPLTFQLVDTTQEEIKDESEDSPGPAVVLVLLMLAGIIARRASKRLK